MEWDVLNGNELIVQGGMEAGFSLYTGYPGSPLGDFFNILHKKQETLKEQGIKVVIANSEANAAAMASGAKQAGRNCLVAMKSMGLNVASDALCVGNFANPGPSNTGVVVVVGDDPWSISTSAPMDSRYLYKHLHIPFLEPATPQELKDWIKVALLLSQTSSVYQGILLTTFMAEGGGRVQTYPSFPVEKCKVTVDTEGFQLHKNVMVPPNSLKADISMIKERFPRVLQVYEGLDLDQIFFNKQAEVGFISTGMVSQLLHQVLEGLKKEKYPLPSFSLYKLAGSYPLVKKNLFPWLSNLKTLVVVEEKRGFLENEIKNFCGEHGISLRIFGKKFDKEEGFPAYGGLDYQIIRQKLSDLFSKMGMPLLSPQPYPRWECTLPRRLPTFCPGCPHRETLSLLKELRQVLKEKNIDLVSHGDVGCYSLSFLAPFKEMHNLSAMGQGGALGAGMDIFTNNPSVVLMGDSTFFHSGVTDVSNSVQLGHNITYILLDNDNTAMTGHQMTPATGMSVEGIKRPRQDMVEVVQSLGVDRVHKVNPSDRYFYKNLMMEMILSEGVKVIVSDKECALTFHGRRKKREMASFSSGKVLPLQSFYQINTSVCEDCRVCVEMTGCPGLTKTFDAYGSKVQIDPQICVADSYCTKLKACPSFSLVEVVDYHPRKYQKNKKIKINDLPLPQIRHTLDDIASGKNFKIVVTGVGGSGVTTISRVLSHAAKEMEGSEIVDFKFVDQKGLAQRNGNVTAHLSYYKKGTAVGAVSAYGEADVLLSPDLLDGMTHIRFLSENGFAFFDKKYQVPLSVMLDYEEEKALLSEEQMQKMAQDKLKDRLYLLPMKETSSNLLGKSIYSSAICLGAVYQSGNLPFSLESMQKAFTSVVPSAELDNNLFAFQLGRELYLKKGDMESFLTYDKKNSICLWRESVRESIVPWQNKSVLLSLFDLDVKRLQKIFGKIRRKDILQYIHDLYIYNRNKNREDFFTKASELSLLYEDKELQKKAISLLVRSYFIKDEIFVSHIMISPIQRKKERDMYLKWGKKFKISPINRPSFNIGNLKWEFDISPKRWMLKIMRHMRIIRFLLPSWHKKEKEINDKIRHELCLTIHKLDGEEQRTALMRLENIKGYRDVRYKKAEVLHS